MYNLLLEAFWALHDLKVVVVAEKLVDVDETFQEFLPFCEVRFLCGSAFQEPRKDHPIILLQNMFVLLCMYESEIR